MGHNEYEAEYMVCIPGTFVSVANRELLDLEAHMKNTQGNSSSFELSTMCYQTQNEVSTCKKGHLSVSLYKTSQQLQIHKLHKKFNEESSSRLTNSI
jgi:hypothetical protein